MRSWRDVCWADVQASYLTTTGGILEIYLRRYFDTQLQLNFYLSVCITHRLLIKTILPKHHLRASTPPDLCTMDRGVQKEFVMHSLRKYLPLNLMQYNVKAFGRKRLSNLIITDQCTCTSFLTNAIFFRYLSTYSLESNVYVTNCTSRCFNPSQNTRL